MYVMIFKEHIFFWLDKTVFFLLGVVLSLFLAVWTKVHLAQIKLS